MPYRSIKERDYPTLFRLDRAVYPTTSPVTAEVVNEWYRWNREFGIVFPGEEPEVINGLFILIPLSKLGWEKLISGELTEAQMSGEMIFNPQKDDSLGLHNYHIENFTEQKGFYKEALSALGTTVKTLTPKVKLLGFSAYAVTEAGVGLHEGKLKMHERSFVSDEYVIKEDGKLRVSRLSPDEAERLESTGAKLLRCKMLITTPDEESEVWKFLG